MKHKLFKKYYPIQTEEQKDAFLKEYRDSVLKFLKRELLRCHAMHMDAFMDYEKHLKDPIGFSGKIKWKAVAKNNSLACRFERVTWDIDRYQSEYNRLGIAVDSNTASVDDINVILTKMNNRFNGTIIKYASFAMFVIVLAVICKLIT